MGDSAIEKLEAEREKEDQQRILRKRTAVAATRREGYVGSVRHVVRYAFLHCNWVRIGCSRASDACLRTRFRSQPFGTI